MAVESVQIGGVQVDRGTVPMWAAVLGGPIVWLLQFQVNYMLVPWVCTTGHQCVRHLLALLALLLVLGGGWLACVEWRRQGRGGMEEDLPGFVGRTRFLSMLGMLSSILFALLIVMQDIASFFLSPCWV
jgi:hypothetical protein